MLKDKRGNPLSYRHTGAASALDAVIEKLHAYQADPLADIDAVIAEHPDFAMAHALRAGMIATAADKAFEPELRKSVEAAEKLARSANDRERGHIAAVRLWLDDDFEGATEMWGRVAIADPRDSVAIQFAHLGDFFHGYSHMLRDRIARVLPHWTPDVPGYGFIQGMYAFGLEESGDYAAAEAIGREAAARNPQDGWAVHAVTHVMEMQGRAREGAEWLTSTAHGWAPNSMFGYHNWWHLALFHLDAGETGEALSLFDAKVSASGFGQAIELVDGSALLWRLALLGHDVGNRWNDIADKWQARIDDGYYAFNDLHAMMAFVGAGRREAQKRLIAIAERVTLSRATNGMMTREVGLPALRGFEAFGRGAYDEAIGHLMPLRAKANRFGGSHAQRDVFSWTLIEAALRSGDRPLAGALIAERLAAKPDSPLNRAWASRSAKGRARAA